MSDKSTNIQKQIEDIDIELYNLLMKRSELVKKNPYPAKIENILGQEAMGIRRMLKYHNGDFPEYVIAKIWREIIGASANMQERLKIAVYGDESDALLLHDVQEHFGSYIDVSLVSSFSQAFNQVSTHEADLAIVPADNHEMNTKPWWNSLLKDETKESLNIVAKLPFVRFKNAAPERESYVIARTPSDACGIDNSLFAVETDIDVSGSTITETFNASGFSSAKLVVSTNTEETKFSLVEVKGFCRTEDINIPDVNDVFKNLHLVGTYARPLEL